MIFRFPAVVCILGGFILLGEREATQFQSSFQTTRISRTPFDPGTTAQGAGGKADLLCDGMGLSHRRYRPYVARKSQIESSAVWLTKNPDNTH